MKPSSLREFRPGLFVTFAPHADESFNGYLLRLASANRLSGIKGLIKVLVANFGAPIKSPIEILVDAAALGELGAMATGNREALLHFTAKPLGEGALFIHGCRIDGDAMMSRFAQICPSCLADRGVADVAWDYAPVVACSMHKSVLIDCCSQCHKRIDWTRPHLLHCGACGHDLREIEASHAAPAVVEASDDFAALAPFRFLHKNGLTERILWDAAFRLLKAGALDRVHWCTGEYPERNFFNELSHIRRYAVIESFVLARKWNGYRLRFLGSAFAARVKHLSQIPADFVVERYVMQFLISQAAISHSIASAIAFDNPPPEKSAAAYLFSGKPPIIRTLDEVSRFLGCDLATVNGLFTVGKLSQPQESPLGHDIDELVDAARFLKEDLLGMTEICHMLGVPIDWEDLQRNQVIPRWNPKAQSDCRVSVSNAVDVQNRLQLAIEGMQPPSSPIRLGALAAETACPCLVVLAGASLLLSRGLCFATWKSPGHSWADITIDESEADLVLCGPTRSGVKMRERERLN